MAAKAAAYANSLLQLIFNAVTITGLAQDNTSGTPLTNLYVALHTADPSASGLQNNNEISYTPYARIAIVRTSSGFTVSGNSVSPAATVVFAAMASGTGGTATYWSVGVGASGATAILYSGAISPTIAVAVGVTPELTTATAVTES